MPPKVAGVKAKKPTATKRKPAAPGAAKKAAAGKAKPRKVGTASKAKRMAAGVKGQPVRREVLAQVKLKLTPRQTLTFRARGPFKCVVDEQGKSLAGMHPSLASVCGNFDYDKAKKAGTLVGLRLPPADVFEPIPACIRKERHLAYSSKEGHKLDVQIGQVAAWHNKKGVNAPLIIFLDSDARKRFFARGTLKPLTIPEPYIPISNDHQESIKKLCKVLMTETLQVIHFCYARNYRMVATQECVARGAIGTLLDLVLVTPTGEHIVVELKAGCDQAWTAKKPMSYPFATHTVDGKLVPFISTTHVEYMLQTMMNRRCFQHTFPAAKLHEKTPCILLIANRQGVHVYLPSSFFLQREQALASVIRC